MVLSELIMSLYLSAANPAILLQNYSQEQSIQQEKTLPDSTLFTQRLENIISRIPSKGAPRGTIVTEGFNVSTIDYDLNGQYFFEKFTFEKKDYVVVARLFSDDSCKKYFLMVSGDRFVLSYDLKSLDSKTATDPIPDAYDVLEGKSSKLFKSGPDAAKLVSEKLLPDAEKYVAKNK